MVVHVFGTKERASDWASKKNKNAIKYRWKIQDYPHGKGYMAYKVKK